MAEVELNLLINQCVYRRIDNLDEVQDEVAAWQNRRNNATVTESAGNFPVPVPESSSSAFYPTLDSRHDTRLRALLGTQQADR